MKFVVKLDALKVIMVEVFLWLLDDVINFVDKILGTSSYCDFSGALKQFEMFVWGQSWLVCN